jgi:uncharacterized protein
MGAVRALLLFVLLGVVLWLLRKVLRQAAGNGQPATQKDRPPSSADPVPMAACRYCGLHLPETEAVRDGLQVFCSEPHRLAHAREQGGPRPPGQEAGPRP